MRMALKRNGFIATTVSLLILALVAGCSSQRAAEKGADEGGKSAATEYANPELLTETAWLKENLADADLKIVDVRTPEEYAAGHIKGAVNMPGHSTDVTVGAVPSMLAPPEKVAQMLGERGISNDSNVVIYDGQITPPAGRTFWILEYLGHKRVSVLNGGLMKWKKEGGEVSKDAPSVTKATYTPSPVPDAYATKDEVRALVGKKGALLIDARPAIEYIGGHIEGSKRMDWTELLTQGEPSMMKPAGELEKLFADAGATKDIDLVAY